MLSLTRSCRILLAFAAAMIMAILPAYAQDAEKGSLTIVNDQDVPHTFELYQILTGQVTLQENTRILSNPEWGSGIASDSQLSKLDPVVWAEGLNAKITNPDTRKDTLREISQSLGDAVAGQIVAPKESYTFTNLDPGYYLLKDRDGSQEGKEGGASTEFILRILDEDLEQQLKIRVPELKKTVSHLQANGDSRNEELSTADFSLGEKMEFRLLGTLPENYDSYESYQYSITDIPSAGIRIDPESIEVLCYSDGHLLSTKDWYEVSLADGEEGQKLVFTVKPGKDNHYLKNVFFRHAEGMDSSGDPKDRIEIIYRAVLTEQAAIGGSGSRNEAQLTYSSNPNGTGDSVSMTPKAAVTIYTYQIDINKYKDSVRENNRLEGAEFELYRLEEGALKKIDVLNYEEGYHFHADRLGSGTYILKESKSPVGYNKLEGTAKISDTEQMKHALRFEIQAEYGTDPGDHSLKNLKGVQDGTGTVCSGSTVSGILTINVIDKPGIVLPETGGSGTRAIMIAGSALILIGMILTGVKRHLGS